MIAGVVATTDFLVGGGCMLSDDTAIESMLLSDQDDHLPVVSDFVN